MLLGMIADSHDNLPKIKKTVSLFNKNKVELVLHAGDYVAPFSIEPLEDLRCNFFGIFGNNDGEKKGLIKKSKNRIKEGPLSLKLDNKKVLLIHDISEMDEKYFKRYNLIIYGHTHKPGICQKNGTLLINPGECGGWLTGKASIAVCELKSMRIDFIRI